ncbi:MAG: hypothetical protein N3F67_00410 [Acidilobaceae archaeon]|nr:hypothetical protein [Acidilobaceae archaeon]
MEEERRVKIRSEEDKMASIIAEKVSLILFKGLLPEIRRIREKVERLEEEVSAIKSMLEERGERGGRREGGNDAVRRTLAREGFLVVGEASKRLGLSPAALVEEARRAGAVVLDAGGDAVLMTPAALEEFSQLMREARSRDPEEAARHMGKFARAFEVLRRGGMIIYDGKEGRWSMIE